MRSFIKSKISLKKHSSQEETHILKTTNNKRAVSIGVKTFNMNFLIFFKAEILNIIATNIMLTL